MPIDNPVLLRFCNETVRPLADRLGGLLPLLSVVPATVQGQELATAMGTTNEQLFRPQPWTNQDYSAVPRESIAGSDSGGRTLLTNHDVIGLVRVIAALGAMQAANPSLAPLVGKLAVNPRA